MKNIILVIIYLTSFIVYSQEIKDLNINYMLRGQIYAQSSIVDSTALGGYGSSNNLPKEINGKFNNVKPSLFMKIDTSKTIQFANKYYGYKLFLGNKTDTIIKLNASDSRLSIVAEVYYRNKWKPIEYLPSSWCGNSYHNIYLKQNEYWSFEVPKFSGKIKTKLRYKLMFNNDKVIYSNEVEASFNKGQVKNKKEYEPFGIMDPYND